MSDVADRLLNPGVVLTMIVAGIAYGYFLWKLDIRGTFRTWAVASFSGGIFLLVIWSIRAAQGVAASTYLALLIDWIIFSNVGFHAVMTARWYKRRRAE